MDTGTVLRIKIEDGSFPQTNSATLAGDNTGLGPKHFQWVRDKDFKSDVVFFTDICLHLVHEYDYLEGKRIAWLLEPREINSTSYEYCVEHQAKFDYVLTHDLEYLISEKWLYYPFGGSWVREDKWKVWPKNKEVSIIASEKALTDGHKLRHQIIDEYSLVLDVMGRGYEPIASKTQGLIPFRYSIVVENSNRDGWFTEKIIDCFSVGTIPIYWGTQKIWHHFDPDGIIPFGTIQDLDEILSTIGERDYQSRIEAINRNLELAYQYRCAEDWIFEHYPFLFE